MPSLVSWRQAMDKYDSETRSRMMAAVRSRGNKSTELEMIQLLRTQQLTGWRRHLKLPGRPDFCWIKYKVVLFVDGCFWHGCPACRRPPKSNTTFWDKKILANRRRDRKVNRLLRRLGWRVIRVRECRLKHRATLLRLKRFIGLSAKAE